jgi:hypothetical protein
MTNLLDKIKEYINNVAHNVKEVFSLNDDLDKINLDEIIERDYKKAIESLRKFKIIEYIERKYEIDYKIPELEIVEDDPSIIGKYLPLENKIRISKKSIERELNNYLEFLGYKKGSISDMSDIAYLNISYNSKFLFPFYVNKRNIRKAIAEVIILLTIFHEIWHSIDLNILNKLKNDSAIKDNDYSTFLKNFELRASAFGFIMYYLVNGFYKDEKGYMAAYKNIPECRNYIENIDKIEKKDRILYDLGYCYGNNIIATNKELLKENIYNIIDGIVRLDKERAIKVINLYENLLRMSLYN